jgi:TonB-linked SusC/RagA family outer membrane protein
LESANFNQPVYPGATQTYAQTNTDWQDAYFRKGSMMQHNIGISGGNEVSRFYTSAGYFDQDGTAPHVGYKRYNFRLNSDHKISKVFTFGENLYMAFGNQRFDNNETGSRTNLVNVIRSLPYQPVYDPTSIGGYRGADNSIDASDPTNPVEDAELKNPGYRRTVKLFGTAFLEINLAKSLKFRSTFGVDYANGLASLYTPIFNDNGAVGGSSASLATITNNRTISTQLLNTQALTFDNTYGNHHINVLGVFETQEQKIQQENASGNQKTNEIKTLLNALNMSVGSRRDGNFLMSFLTRANYDFAGKYIVSAAIRRDGLSIWAPGKKWATFPSASVGWRIDQEDFMKDNNKISELKIRAGYGITGLNGTILGNYPWQVNVDGNSTVYPFNNALNSNQGSSINSLGNPNLEWEETKQLNIGLDLGLLRNKVTLSAEYFKRNTDNLIIQVPSPFSFGYSNNQIPTNIGAMQNTGFELLLGYNDREGDFKWNASANASFIKNEVKSLAPGVSNIEAGGNADFGGGVNITRTEPGHAVQSFYGYIVEGIFQNQAEVAASPVQVKNADEPNNPTKNTWAGDLKFRDINKDGKIDASDRVFLGSYLPKATYAFNAGANYKNFDLSVFFQGVQGNKIFNAARIITEGGVRLFNASTAVLRAWTPTNTATDIPRSFGGDPNANVRPSNRWIEDGSYLRLKNLMIGYNIPGATLQSLTKGVVSSFRVYASGQNLLTFTKYSGLDPEVGNRTPGAQLTNGIDYAVYPQPRSFQVGIQANF